MTHFPAPFHTERRRLVTRKLYRAGGNGIEHTRLGFPQVVNEMLSEGLIEPAWGGKFRLSDKARERAKEWGVIGRKTEDSK